MLNQYSHLSAESEVDALARMTPEECAEYEQWLDSHHYAEDNMLESAYEARTDIGE